MHDVPLVDSEQEMLVDPVNQNSLLSHYFFTRRNKDGIILV